MESSRGSEKTINYILAQDRPTLVWLANQACIELHPWLSRRTCPEFPDWLVFDLDPAEGCSFDDVREIAFLVRKALNELGLVSYPKLPVLPASISMCPSNPDIHTVSPAALSAVLAGF